MEKSGFGKVLYERHKPLLDAKEEVYIAQGIVEEPEAEHTNRAQEQAIFHAMRMKQERLTAAHNKAMGAITDTLRNTAESDE